MLCSLKPNPWHRLGGVNVLLPEDTKGDGIAEMMGGVKPGDK